MGAIFQKKGKEMLKKDKIIEILEKMNKRSGDCTQLTTRTGPDNLKVLLCEWKISSFRRMIAWGLTVFLVKK